MFDLDVAKVDLVLHMLYWDPICCSCWGHLHARMEWGTTVRVWDTERHETRSARATVWAQDSDVSPLMKQA